MREEQLRGEGKVQDFERRDYRVLKEEGARKEPHRIPRTEIQLQLEPGQKLKAFDRTLQHQQGANPHVHSDFSVAGHFPDRRRKGDRHRQLRVAVPVL